MGAVFSRNAQFRPVPAVHGPESKRALILTVVFASNYLNHHQLPLSLCFTRAEGVSYTFIATAPVSEERKKLGYSDLDRSYPFVLRAYDSEESRRQALALCMDCDVLIYGSATDDYIAPRLKAGKLTFKYAERLYKNKVTPWTFPHQYYSAKKHFSRFSKYPLYILCASAYTAGDINRFSDFRGRCFRWGYFPECRRYPDTGVLLAGKDRREILWCARFLNWKHPETALETADGLRRQGMDFRMKLIGSGPLEAEIRAQIAAMRLEDHVSMLGSVPSGEVRSYMEQAGIFLMTSDRQEGWGAVLNEAMNSGCAVCACNEIGSVPYLLKDGENGRVYSRSDPDSALRVVESLLRDPELQRHCGEAAYRTVTEEWNAETGVERFLCVADALLRGSDPKIFSDGVCSPAE